MIKDATLFNELGEFKYFRSIILKTKSLFVGTGAKLYIVGGYLRDVLIFNTEPKDIDFATDMDIDKVAELAKAKGIKVVEDLNHNRGTIILELDFDDTVEISSFKTEEYYNKREKSRTGDICEDLGLRDFTINALAFDIFKFELLDPYHGIKDAENKVLRMPISARDRLKDDPLRLLRALRFVSKDPEFRIDPKIFEAAKKNPEIFSSLSRSRVITELDKMIQSENFLISFSYLFSENWICGLEIVDSTPEKKKVKNFSKLLNLFSLNPVLRKNVSEILTKVKWRDPNFVKTDFKYDTRWLFLFFLVLRTKSFDQYESKDFSLAASQAVILQDRNLFYSQTLFFQFLFDLVRLGENYYSEKEIFERLVRDVKLFGKNKDQLKMNFDLFEYFVNLVKFDKAKSTITQLQKLLNYPVYSEELNLRQVEIMEILKVTKWKEVNLVKIILDLFEERCSLSNLTEYLESHRKELIN